MTAKEFLESRIKKEKYNGLNVTHHRWIDTSEVLFILEKIDDYTEHGKKNMSIRTSDLSKGKIDEKWSDYTKFCLEYEDKYEKKNQEDHMRKNIFHNLEKVGLLKREKVGNAFVSVALTRDAQMILEMDDELAKKSLIGEYIYNSIYFNAGKDYKYRKVMEDLITSLGYITIEEFQFFLSGLEMYDDIPCDCKHIKKYVEEYRRLPDEFGREEIKEYCEKIEQKNIQLKKNENKEVDKKDKRDFNNWRNDAGAFFNFSNLSDRVEVETSNGKKILSIQTKLSSDEKFIRDKKVVEIAKKRSPIPRYEPFEMHHIIPCACAKTVSPHKRNFTEILAFLIDSEENLIALTPTAHRKIKNKYIKIENNGENMLFIDPYKPTDKKELKKGEFYLKSNEYTRKIKYNSMLLCLLKMLKEVHYNEN